MVLWCVLVLILLRCDGVIVCGDANVVEMRSCGVVLFLWWGRWGHGVVEV